MGAVEEATLTDSHGVEVFYRRWPRAGSRASVVIVHGASEHSGRYGRFAAALNEAAFEALALDLRGHGRTGESTGAGRMGPGGAAGLLEDVGRLVSAAAEANDGAPVVLLGHSLGSVVAQAYATQPDNGLAAYILSGPVGAPEGAAELAAGLRQAADAGMGDEPLDLLSGHNAAFEPARTPYDWLSRDPAEVDAYISDPYCGDGNPLTYGFVADLFEAAVPTVEPDRLATMPRLPVLLVAGEADPVGGPDLVAVKELASRLESAGLAVVTHYYPGARHEVLNETNRTEVTSDILDWLHRTV